MEENTHRKWDVAIQLFGSILTLVGILIGVWQFNAGQKENLHVEDKLMKSRDSLETVNKLWEQKITVYAEIGTAVGGILASTGKDSIDGYIKNYLILYYGKAIIVQDSIVRKKMNGFRTEIYHFLNNNSSEEKLKAKGRALGDAIRQSIRKKSS